MRRVVVLCALVACGGEPAATPDGAPVEIEVDAAAPDPHPGAGTLVDGDNAVGPGVYRIETRPDEHVAFVLTFPVGTPGVVLGVEHWTGTTAVKLGETDAGAGKRFLAVRDRTGPSTYWVTITGELAGTLTVTRTPFADGNACASDCAKLLQLPLPNDPAVDGYATDGSTVFRYWFGRRDLVMFLREAGARQAAAGGAPFIPQDLSQWDGATPGTDVGAPRHASHQRGKDVDLSIYGSDGRAPWRSYCTTTTVDGGRQCIDGSVRAFDGYATALAVASLFETGRVTMSFLDRELIEQLVPDARRAAADGALPSSLVPLYGDGQHVQHWPNHDNHIHVRVSEATDASRVVPVFEAP